MHGISFENGNIFIHTKSIFLQLTTGHKSTILDTFLHENSLGYLSKIGKILG
jgi:hypothetical protein